MPGEAHIAAGVDEDHQHQEGHHEEHQGIGRVHRVADGKFAVPGRDRVDRLVNGVFAEMIAEKRSKGNAPSQQETDDRTANRNQGTTTFVAVEEENDR